MTTEVNTSTTKKGAPKSAAAILAEAQEQARLAQERAVKASRAKGERLVFLANRIAKATTEMQELVDWFDEYGVSLPDEFTAIINDDGAQPELPFSTEGSV